MLELYIAISLIGLGYLANKNGKQDRKAPVNNNQKILHLNQDNIYENNISKKVNNLETNTANNLFKEAKKSETTTNPYQSNLLLKNNLRPEQYINNNLKNDNMILENNLTGNPVTGNPVKRNSVSENMSLEQEPAQSNIQENFTHNNMVPFFGGSVKQTSNMEHFTNVLNNHTGRNEFNHHKKEKAPLFDNKQAMSYVNGSPNYDYSSRFNVSNNRKNDLPFTQIRVAPGLGLDYGNEGAGNFHQFEINNIIKPKTVDELRSASNPKMTYKGRIVSGKKIDKRSKVGEVKHYRPDKFYHNNPDRYFTTTGDEIKPKVRENVYAKRTEKECQREYTGAAGPTTHTKPSKIPLHQKSRRNIYKKSDLTNATAQGQWNESAENSDYGKNSIKLRPNERDVTQKRTHLSNLITNVKALITPIQDIIKPTKKENFIGNNRPEGNISMPGPEKITVHDPNDVARTTIKETTIDNEHTGQLSGPSKLTAHDPNDIARTTTKETTINNEHEGHISGPSRITVYDPNDVARTTIKETTIDNEHEGNMTGPKRLTVYDPNDIARTTIKETLLHDARAGSYSGELKRKLYLMDEAKTTLRETLDDLDYNKHLKANLKHRVYERDAKTTIKETTIDNKRGTGNAKHNKDGGYMIDPAEAPNTNRQFTSDEPYTGNPDGDVGIGGGEGYLTSNYEAPNTSRQFTCDEEYMGHAGSKDDKQMSYDDMYNARLNVNKEKISQGRAPTQTGVKVASGEESMNVAYKKQMSDVEFRPNENNRIINRIRRKEDYNLTTYKDALSNELNVERIDPDYLDQFNNNPYTKPLNSYS